MSFITVWPNVVRGFDYVFAMDILRKRALRFYVRRAKKKNKIIVTKKKFFLS